MKKYINGIMVVEGKQDVAYLSNFIDTNFFITNGFDVEKEIDFLLVAEGRNIPIYVMTDSDSSGLEIRRKLHQKLSKIIDIEVDINQCDKKGKHGVAECKVEEIMRVLHPYFVEKPQNQDYITTTDILLLENKNEVISYIKNLYKINAFNNKILVNKLNMLRVKKEELNHDN